MGVFRQFPYSNFHEMNMDEIIKIVKNMLEEWAQYHAEWDAWMNQMNDDWSNYQEVMNEAWENMQDFINNYFDNLDVQNEINNKIASMVRSGEFATIVEPFIPPRVTAWLTEHITEPVGVVIDTSLSVEGACADAKATGDADAKIIDALNRFIVTRGTTSLNNYYVNANTGEISEHTSHNPNATSGISVYGDYVEIALDTCPLSGVRGIAFYDDEDTYISGLAYTVDVLRYLVDIPTDAKTMAVTSFEGDDTFGLFFGYHNIDKTLSVENKAADAASVGRAINDLTEMKTALDEIQATFDDTPTRAVTVIKSGFMLENADNAVSIKFTPKFSSASNPFTEVSSGTFRLTVYNITRGDTIDVGEVAYPAKTYNIGDEIYLPLLKGNMFCSFDLIRDSESNQAFLGYTTEPTAFKNTLGYILNDAVTTFNYGCAMSGSITKYYASGTLSVLQDKKITLIGDSITEHNYRALTNWPMWMTNWTNCEIQNLSVSGSGFIRTSPYINRIPSIQSTPDIIGIAMTWNDLSASVGLPIGTPTDTGTSSIAGYVNDFFDALITAYPSTPIIAYIQSPWGDYRPSITIADEYVSVMTELLARKGIPFYKDIYYGSALKPWITANQNVYFKVDTPSSAHYGETDSTHPNSLGHKVIARYLYPEFVKNVVANGKCY